MSSCVLCGAAGGPADVAVDLGRQPSMRCYPLPTDPGPDPTYPLALWVCPACGLAQLVSDETDEPEVPVPEPAAVAAHERQLIADLGPLLDGRRTVRAFPSPHGGTGTDQYRRHGLTLTDGPADVVVDSYGIMHDADQAAAFAARAAAVAPGGLLVLTIQPLSVIVASSQWSAIRHGHRAYYTATVVRDALAPYGLVPTWMRAYDLYGGSAVVVARRDGQPDDALTDAYAQDDRARLAHPDGFAGLVAGVETSLATLRTYLDAQHRAGVRLYAYGAPSRVIALLASLGDQARVITATADAAPAKQGRCLPGSRIPVISPAELVAADPDEVLLMLDDLYDEVLAAYPSLAGRLVKLADAIARLRAAGE